MEPLRATGTMNLPSAEAPLFALPKSGRAISSCHNIPTRATAVCGVGVECVPCLGPTHPPNPPTTVHAVSVSKVREGEQPEHAVPGTTRTHTWAECQGHLSLLPSRIFTKGSCFVPKAKQSAGPSSPGEEQLANLRGGWGGEFVPA